MSLVVNYSRHVASCPSVRLSVSLSVAVSDCIKRHATESLKMPDADANIDHFAVAAAAGVRSQLPGEHYSFMQLCRSQIGRRISANWPITPAADTIRRRLSLEPAAAPAAAASVKRRNVVPDHHFLSSSSRSMFDIIIYFPICHFYLNLLENSINLITNRVSVLILPLQASCDK